LPLEYDRGHHSPHFEDECCSDNLLDDVWLLCRDATHDQHGDVGQQEKHEVGDVGIDLGKRDQNDDSI
jgi:hypothetical protein